MLVRVGISLPLDGKVSVIRGTPMLTPLILGTSRKVPLIWEAQYILLMYCTKPTNLVYAEARRFELILKHGKTIGHVWEAL